MTDEADAWMQSRDALARAVAILGGDRGRAMTSIREGASRGRIRTRARLLSIPCQRPQHDVDLPALFWAPAKGLLGLALPVPMENWHQGNFHGGGLRFGGWVAGDVSFLKRDIDQRYRAPVPLTSGEFPRTKRGRKKGVGGYELLDDPLVAEMLELIEGGHAQSVHGAAVQVTPKAKPESTTPASRTKRLLGRFKKQHPDFVPPARRPLT